jgi:hypothetical protein
MTKNYVDMTAEEIEQKLASDPAERERLKQCLELLHIFEELSPDGKEEVINYTESLEGGKKMAEALRQITANLIPGATKG